MLTTAQLLTDRLERTTDPLVERVAPRLMATLDRAISFCEATLAYGRAAERRPERRPVPLKPLVEELGDLTAPRARAWGSCSTPTFPTASWSTPTATSFRASWSTSCGTPCRP